MSRLPTVRADAFLHPASGALILGLDWLFFSGTVVTLGLSTPALAGLGFVLGALGTGFIQRRYQQEGTLPSVLKGIGAGIVVGLPLPIAGTAVGGGILALSGLNKLGRGSPSEESAASADQEPRPKG